MLLGEVDGKVFAVESKEDADFLRSLNANVVSNLVLYIDEKVDPSWLEGVENMYVYRLLALKVKDLDKLKELARKGDSTVRTNIAIREDIELDEELLDILLNDPDPNVVATTIHKHMTIPYLKLKKMLEEGGVKAKIVLHLGKLEASDYEEWMQKGEQYAKLIAANKFTPQHLLYRLAEMGSEVRRELVKNPSLPPKLLYKLAEDEDERVRAGVATHKNSPKELKEKLKSDPSPMVSAFAEFCVGEDQAEEVK